MHVSRWPTTLFSACLLTAAGWLVSINAPVALAQVTTAAIHGAVTDPSGASVPDAKVTATDTATGISTTTTTTNQSGFYNFPSLQVGGPYTISIEHSGFQKFQSKGTMLSVNANVAVDAKLTLGVALQTVTVSANAVQVETTNTQMEQIVPASQLENLPILERDAAALERLAPGVMESNDRFGSYSVDGSQTTDNSFVLQGIDNNDGALQNEGLEVNPDALVQENAVESTINPEFARNSGSVINQVVKAGTNSFHGDGFEFYRDTFMNNRNYFSILRPQFHQNLYGGTLGGPLVKNRLFFFLAYQGYRNRTGSTVQTPVFPSGLLSTGNFSTESNVYNSGPDGTVGLAPDPIPFDITAGPGAANAGVTCGPGTAYSTWVDCFPAGTPVVISPASFNPLATALTMKYVPPGNAGSATAPLYDFNTTDTGAQDQGVLRADYHIDNSDSIYGVGIFQSSPSTDTLPFGSTTFQGADLPGFGQANAEHYKLFSAQEQHIFNATTLNVLRAGYYRLNYAAVEPIAPVAPSSVGFAIAPQTAESGLPVMALTGLFNLGFSSEGPQPRKDTNLTYSDDLSQTIGNHNLKFGATLEQFRVSNPYYADNNGLYDYQGTGTYSSGDPGLDFLLGIPDSYTQSSGGFIDALAYEYYAFAQDSWRATPDLTLNYGLAWDVETPNSNKQYGGVGIVCFQLNSRTSTVFPGGFPGLLYPGDPGCNQAGGATTHWAHFGPRFGFAWSPSSGPSALIGSSGNHQFSLRGGFGLYYNRDQEEGQLQNLGDPPFYKQSLGAADFLGSPSFQNPFADILTGATEPNPFPFVRPARGTPLDWANFVEQNISVISPNYDVPYVYNVNLNIQRQLPGNMIMQIGYVGSLGRKLVLVWEGDPITAAGHAACLANPACVANRSEQHLLFPQDAAQPATLGGLPDYLSVGTQGTEGSSNYNSLQASLNKATSHGLYFTLAYTYSHGLDNASGLESSGFNGLGYNWVPGFEYLSYGDSDYDARQRLVASYNYGIPLFSSLRNHFAVNEILGGWHAAGFTVLQNGFPITVTNIGTFNSLWCDRFSYYSCPDNENTSSFAIPQYNPRSNPVTHLYFDTSLFSQEPIGTFGNVKRNFFHGPGFDYTNLSVYKQFPLGHDVARNLQIMLQGANIFNHANFANPDSNFTDGPLFGNVLAVRNSGNTEAGNDANGDPAPGRTAQIVARINF